MASAFGTLGNIPTLTIAGRVFTDLTSIIHLVAYVAGGAATRYGSFRLPSGSAGYTVTALKTLTVEAFKATNDAAATPFFKFQQSDNDCGTASNTAPTNPVYLAGLNAVHWVGPAAAGSNIEGPVGLPVAAGKYFSLDSVASGNGIICHAWGYEV